MVPQILHEEVLTDLHEGALDGHFGMNKTLAGLKECFYLPGHYNDVCDLCRNCGCVLWLISNQMKSSKTSTQFDRNVVTFGLKTSLHVLGEHNGMKTELYRTNNKSQGLAPAFLH